MKNLRISTRLSIIISAVLLVGLSVLCVISNVNMRKVMYESATTRMQETVQVRSSIIENYVQNAENFLQGYAQGTEVTDTLTKPTAQNVSKLQDYTIRYASVNDKLENIYLTDDKTYIYAGMVESTIGITMREGDKLRELTDKVFSSKDVYNTGVLTSPSTGSQVLAMYYPVYDSSSKPIGIAGMALKADELLDTLNELEFVGLNGCSYYLLDAGKSAYISSEDTTKNGSAIEDSNLLELIEKVSNMDGNSTIVTEYKDSVSGEEKIAVYKYIEKRNWIFSVEVLKAELYKKANYLSGILIAVCAIVLIVCISIIWLLTNYSLKTVRVISSIISSLGTLDLKQGDELKKYLNRKDETGMIASAAYLLTQELIKIILKLKDDSKKLLISSSELKKVFYESAVSVEQVENAISDIASCSTSQAEETQGASEQVIRIGSMVDELAQKTYELYDNSTYMNDIGAQAMDSLQLLQKLNEKTEKSVGIIYQQTSNTNTSADKIQNAVSIITAIAEETSLLSLNASIEAARAGEQGRGFSVVATQIKKLAEQSNESAVVINDVINSLIQDSQNAVLTMEEVQENFKLQSGHVDKTLSVFKQLKEKIDQSITWVNNISYQAKEMNNARAKVVQSVSDLSAIAEENAASTEETSASVTLVNEHMQSIQASASMLENMANDLRENISKFKIND